MRNKDNSPLSNEQIQKWAPSAFAEQPYHTASDRYAFLPTTSVIDGLRAAGFVPVDVRQSSSRTPGKELFTKHQIRFRNINDIGGKLTVGDTHIEGVGVNSHDGTSRYIFSIGAFRVACENGLMVSEGLIESIRIKHTGDIVGKVIEGMSHLMEQAERITEAIRLWKSIELSQTEQRFLAEGAYNLRFDADKNMGNLTPLALLTPRRSADSGNDLYTVFNRVQENTIKGGSRYYTTDAANHRRRNSVREVKGIDQSDKLNRELWALASKMAELKTGR